MLEGLGGGGFTEAQHQVGTDDAEGHVPAQQERQPAKHLLPGDLRVEVLVVEDGADALGQLLVVRHVSPHAMDGKPEVRGSCGLGPIR